MEPVALRPLNFGEVLDTSFNLFKRNFKAVVLVSAAIMVPLSLLGAAAAAGLAPSDLSALDDPNADVEDILGLFGGFLGAIGLGSLLQIVGSILVQAATTRIYSESYRGGSMAAGDALRHGFGRLPGMLGLTLLTTIGTFAGLILCLAPGVWLYAAWGLAPAALIAEPTSPIKALGRSFNLVKGNWWRVFGLLLLAGILVAIISGTVTAPLQLGATFGVGIRRQSGLRVLGHLRRSQHTRHRSGHRRDASLHRRRGGGDLLRPAGPQGGLRPRTAHRRSR
jgi:hypothetical protein